MKGEKYTLQIMYVNVYLVIKPRRHYLSYTQRALKCIMRIMTIDAIHDLNLHQSENLVQQK